MKRYADLWPGLINWKNLLLAAKRARRGKRDRPVVQQFDFQLEWELLLLRSELEKGSYHPGPFRTHKIFRPKTRMISAAPYRDRVVHHAIMNVLEPILETHFYQHSYACRVRKGTHAASRHLQTLLRTYRYSLQFDIRKFFPSIDHDVLKIGFRRRLKDRSFLKLLELIVDGSNPQEPVLDYFSGDDLFTPFECRKGLPIGNLTSQWFANWYLDPLDHWLTSHMRIGGHVRYCDDFVILDNDRQKLCEMKHAVPEFLAKLRLKVHSERLAVLPSAAGRTFVGYRILPSHRVITAEGKQRFLRRLRWIKRSFVNGDISREAVHGRLMSWMGHAGQADSLPLLRKLAADWVFIEGKFDHFR